MPLSPNALKEADAYLYVLPQPIRKKGRHLFDEGLVGKIQETESGVFEGLVTRNGEYDVTLAYLEESGCWSGDCTCARRENCEHCCAVLMAVVEAVKRRAGKAGKAAKAKEEEEEPTAPPPTAPKAKVKPEPERVSRIAAERLNRKLTAAEQKTIADLERIYSQCRQSTQIFETSLAPLLAEKSYWSWEKHELWPKPPANAWQAWLYIAHWAKKKGARLPAFLEQITPQEEIDAVVRDWEREKSIGHWRELLQQAKSRAEVEAPVAIELRLALEPERLVIEWRNDFAQPFKELKEIRFCEWQQEWPRGRVGFEKASLLLWRELATRNFLDLSRGYRDRRTQEMLNILLRTPGLESLVLNPAREPFRRTTERLIWESSMSGEDYRFALRRADGSAPPPLLATVEGHPALYLSHEEIFEGPALEGLPLDPTLGTTIPGPALETPEGVTLLDRIGAPLPERLEKRVHRFRLGVQFRFSMRPDDSLWVQVVADLKNGQEEHLEGSGWTARGKVREASSKEAIVILDQSLQPAAKKGHDLLRMTWIYMARAWSKPMTKKFPEQWLEWIANLPEGIEVVADPQLESLRASPVTAQVTLEVDEAGIDWFDLRVRLTVSDTELSGEEIDLLLAAHGAFVRLGEKGWRRMEYALRPEDEERLADIGLNARDFSGEKQRLHALQLAGKSARALLGAERAAQVARRSEEIKTRVAPEVPAAIHAELRPYQRDGFHFLAYLATNHFGGILADDMGLGKTLQTLAWIAWLREQPDFDGKPVLVVCPKSVSDTWRTEAARFYPSARLRVFRAADEITLADAVREAEIVVLNYAQLRRTAEALAEVEWHVVILDEAQYIKNPTSQTAQAAGALKSKHRLALSGTPIENRLLDLWSIMAFAMPGALGTRAAFGRSFDQKNDPNARRRLAARVRPFVLRRTKSEVASDLPERIEEDVYCELEGEQATLYRAELKRARQALLKLQTAKELDAVRFNILTSLLRLRQICCHPALVKKDGDAESAKLTALLDLLEPLVEEGHKVLVFSQFVEMIGLIQAELKAREWPAFVLTGQTEERGDLVEKFQAAEGAAVFLISLRAGGFGLNLTAASYVVLYDPWWNPAVENQAIDRTHRIGQVNRVVAYRLVVKESIEEKIRSLQKQKSALAADVLGEESFARALTLDDFKFLVGE